MNFIQYVFIKLFSRGAFDSKVDDSKKTDHPWKRSPEEERKARNYLITYIFSGVFMVIMYCFNPNHWASEVPAPNIPALRGQTHDDHDHGHVESIPKMKETASVIDSGNNSMKPKANAKGSSKYSNPNGQDIGPDGIDDTVTAIVECSTTSGDVVIDVRAGWSPLGAEQYLKLINVGHFTNLPFTRVAPRYITQYGRKYIAENSPDKGYLQRGGITVLKDDPPLWGKRDMDFGYIFYAGSGIDSRYDEMVTALCPMKGCIQTGLGKAHWETPVGTIRREYHDVMRHVMLSGKPYPRLEMAGQHPEAGGPNIGKLMQDPDYLKKEYPFMEYWNSCRIIEHNIQQSRPLYVDYPNSIQRGMEKYPSRNPKNSNSNSNGNGDSDSDSVEIGDMSTFKVEMILILNRKNPEQKSRVIIEIYPEWAPRGATQFRKLVKNGFYDDQRVFRVIPKFMSQFGIAGHPETGDKWRKGIKDDVNNIQLSEGNKRGHITFAMAGKNTRTTQLFINTVNNHFLDKQGFTPFGHVLDGMEHIDTINAQYREQPEQGKIQNKGNSYLDDKFPMLTIIDSIKMVV
jgi:peptidyl-prolyl cis-trans isomerase A (cyclophilin A)